MNGAGRLEELLATLLLYGTWLASAVIALGLLLSNPRIATMGVLLFILLPGLRVLLMLFVFVRERNARLACMAALVFAVILLGVVLGFRGSSELTGEHFRTPT